MDPGERLAAYLADELDPGERAALETELTRDPALVARLERLRRAEQMLSSLHPVEPPPEFSRRLRTAVAEELRRSTVEERPTPSRRALRPLLAAAAAAAVVAVVGVGTLYGLRSGGDGSRQQLAGQAPPTVPIRRTDNDFNQQSLRRLAVNIDARSLIPPGLKAEAAEPLADQLTSELQPDGPDVAEMSRQTGDDQADVGAQQAAPVPGAAPVGGDAVQRCLPSLLAEAKSPLVPVYIELARFDGEAATVYVFAAEEPDSGIYRRIEVWAVARADCHVLSFAQYDRPDGKRQR